MPNRPRNSRGRFTATPPLHVTSEDQIPDLMTMVQAGPVTVILVQAGWCPHCVRYKPKWKELENLPGRTANIATVSDEVYKNVPLLKDAKIKGFPSVVKVMPNGAMEEYKVPGSPEATNAVPFMHDMAAMKKALREAEPAAPDSASPGAQSGIMTDYGLKGPDVTPQKGGSILSSFMSALQAVAPAALLYMTHRAVTRRNYKSPKKHRGGTRRARRH